MCQLFSFSVDRQGKVYALLGKARAEALLEEENPDSHTYISKVFGIDEDQTWKYEVPIDISEIEKAVEDGSIKDLSLRRLKYDGGLPEEELKASHENMMRSFLDELDWKKDVLEPMKNPMAFVNIRVSEVIEFFKEERDGRKAFLVTVEQLKIIFSQISHLIAINIEPFDETDRKGVVTSDGNFRKFTHNYDIIRETGKAILTISKRKYWDSHVDAVKMKRVFILSGFEDLTEEEA